MGLFSNIFGWGNSKINVIRNNDGNWSYWLDNGTSECSKDYLTWSLEHPVLFSILALRAKMVSQARILHLDDNDKEIKNSEVLALLKNPNYFQSQQDFIFQLAFFMGATGNNYTYLPTANKTILPKHIYNLVPNVIDWNKLDEIDSFFKTDKDFNDFNKRKIKYRLNNKDVSIEIGNLIPMYDVANGLSANTFIKSPSRVKAIERPLMNIEELLKSKNINAKMSQKFLASNSDNISGITTPLDKDDQTNVRNVLSTKSIQVTNGNVKVTHLVEDLKKLSLDPQIGFDAQMCLLAFGLNNDVLNYFAGGSSTFENQEKGEIRAYQNEIQSLGDNIANSFSSGLNIKGRLVFSYEHLPIMQKVLVDKIDVFMKQQGAIKIALENGTLTTAEAIEMTKQFRNKMKL